MHEAMATSEIFLMPTFLAMPAAGNASTIETMVNTDMSQPKVSGVKPNASIMTGPSVGTLKKFTGTVKLATNTTARITHA